MSGKVIITIILISCACSAYYIAENYNDLPWFKSTIEYPEEAAELDSNTPKATPTPENIGVSSRTRVGRAEFLDVKIRTLDSFYDFERNREIKPPLGCHFIFIEASMKNNADNGTVIIASNRLAVTDNSGRVYPCKSLFCSDRIKKIGDVWLLGQKDMTGMDMTFEVPKNKENFKLRWVAEYRPSSVVKTSSAKKELQSGVYSGTSGSTDGYYDSHSDGSTHSSDSWDSSAHWNDGLDNEFLDRASDWGGIDPDKTWRENMRDVGVVYTGDETSDMVRDYEMIGTGMDVVDWAFGISDSFS